MADEIFVVNPKDSSDSAKTVLVIGFARGGTSLVSGILRELGVFMGYDVHPLKHELDLFHRDDSVESIIRKVESLNSKFAIWGWKSPMAVFFAHRFLHHLRNPHIIVSLRNPVATCISAGRHNSIPIEVAMSETAAVFSALANFTATCPFPLALFNLEAAAANPSEAVRLIKEFVGIPDFGDEHFENAVELFSPLGGYRPTKSERNEHADYRAILALEEKTDSEKVLSNIIPPRIRDILGSIDSLRNDIGKATEIIDHLHREILRKESDPAKGRLEIASGHEEEAVAFNSKDQESLDKTDRKESLDAEKGAACVDFCQFDADEFLINYQNAREELLYVMVRRANMQKEMDLLSLRLASMG